MSAASASFSTKMLLLLHRAFRVHLSLADLPLLVLDGNLGVQLDFFLDRALLLHGGIPAGVDSFIRFTEQLLPGPSL